MPASTPFHENRPTLAAPVRVDPRGVDGPTRSQARSSHWRRSSRGLFVPDDIEVSVEQRIVEAAATLPTGGAVNAWSALRWQGGGWFDGRCTHGTDTLPVALVSCAQDIRVQVGCSLSQERLDPDEVVDVDGLRVVIPVRATFFEMRYATSLREAVVAFEMAAYNDLVSIPEIAAYVLAHPGWTGVPQARGAVHLLDENSWSPWETRMRLLWMLDAGRPRPLTNQPIFDLDGRHVATPDLLDIEHGVVGEYDGSLHLEGKQRAQDARREHALRSVGLEYVALTSYDMSDRPATADRINATFDRAYAIPASRRRWTIEPPSWWKPATTVAERRGLTGTVREAVLAHRSRRAS